MTLPKEAENSPGSVHCCCDHCLHRDPPKSLDCPLVSSMTGIAMVLDPGYFLLVMVCNIDGHPVAHVAISLNNLKDLSFQSDSCCFSFLMRFFLAVASFILMTGEYKEGKCR